MLTLQPFVTDLDGFRDKKSCFIIKELAIATENHTDTVSFELPQSFNSLSTSEQRSHQCVKIFFQCLAWEIGDFQSIAFRFPLSMFYANETEKMDTLRKLLEKEVINVEELLCPKIGNLRFCRDNSL